MVTFSILVSLGSCESQEKGHIQGNVNVGNNKDTLLAVVTQLLPFISVYTKCELENVIFSDLYILILFYFIYFLIAT